MNDAKTHARMLLVASLLLACGGSDGARPPTDPNEPNDAFAQATPITIGTPVVAAISSESDFDHYVFTVPPGGASVRFQTFDSGGSACDPAHGRVDPYIDVYDGAQNWLDWDDDGGLAPYCEDLTVALAEGTTYVVVGGWAPVPFAYTLLLTIPE